MMKPLISVEELGQFSPVFRGKAGTRLAKFILDIFEVTELDGYYQRTGGLYGPDATSALLADLGTMYSVSGEENLAGLPEGPFITVSNHPIGSVDGIALIDYFGHRRPDFKVMVNKFLTRVSNLSDNFITVIPTGEERTSPTAESIGGVREAMAHIRDGHPVGLFPSGAISDYIPGRRPLVTMPDGSSYNEPRVRDREWQLPIVKFVKWAKVPVVPVRFFDGNSPFFYYLGAIHGWKVRVLRFPHEVMNKRGKTIRIGIGPIITPEQQAECTSLEELRSLLRNSVYSQTAPSV